MNNVLVNSDNTFGKYETFNDKVDEVLSAHWYKRTHHQMINNDSNGFYVP